MKLKQRILNIAAFIITLEYLGVTVMCAAHPSWGALILTIISAIACVIIIHQAYFYKYRSR